MEIGSFSNSFESSSVWLHRARGSSSYFSMCQALLKIGLLGESMLPFLIYGQEFYLYSMEALYELEQMVDDSSQKITPELYEKMKSMIAYLHDNRNDMSDQLDHEVNQIYTLVTKVIYPVKKFLKL